MISGGKGNTSSACTCGGAKRYLVSCLAGGEIAYSPVAIAWLSNSLFLPAGPT